MFSSEGDAISPKLLAKRLFFHQNNAFRLIKTWFKKTWFLFNLEGTGNVRKMIAKSPRRF
jgi:hypothetical protein